ncbi:helix-turn-helix domain-containing protein [Oleiharenicola lentus]|uniref:Helix-turn-helix domain-containing protein n=1 Tax=Oleiharenicola lentus TaxID=2508720 RepID=A0A4Q1C911_9BACT|nr:DNA-binding transcriptional regulator [Oleiharenicola lentus]RXK55322.1 helix-turn-helix domain-containing protein [Oleiharenicola lentus]
MTRPKILLVFLMRFEEAARMLQGIVQHERSHRQWATFLDDEARAMSDPDFLRGEKWSGVISRHTTPALVKGCAKLGIPLVDLNDTPPFPGVPKIRPNNHAIGHLGAEHFLERGFRHFAFCGFGNEGWSCERRDGFVEALRLAGQGCDVLDVEYPGIITPDWNASQSRIIGSWLRRLPRPCAIMACVDVRAFQVIAAAQQAGLKVPEEFALLGVNNDVVRCELSDPPLSSVALNAHQSGYHAAEVLDHLLRGRAPEAMDVRIDPVGVVTRLSTDILAVGDRNVSTALNYIREHACKGLSVEEVVTHTAASRSQLEKKFRRFIGRSPQAEIRRVQLARAKELLTETDLPLKSIAGLTGFEHIEYLSVVFKRMTGESPGQYRKRTRTKPH